LLLHNLRYLDLKEQAKEKESVYKATVKKANEFKSHYCARMGELLQHLESHEQHRIEGIKAAIDKIIVYETSQDMNNKYDAKVYAKVIPP